MAVPASVEAKVQKLYGHKYLTGHEAEQVIKSHGLTAMQALEVQGQYGTGSQSLVQQATNSAMNTATQAVGSALSSVINPLLGGLKYAAIWVGLLLLGLGLIFEGLSRNGAPVPRPSTLVMAGGA